MELVKHIKPLAGEGDWPVWKRKIRDLLDYQEGALDVIDGKLEKPGTLEEKASKEDAAEHKKSCDLYRKANSFAKSMISSTVSDAVYQKIMDKTTAKEAWEALKQHYEASSQDQVFKVCADFFAFSWVSNEDVSTHIAKMRTLWNELNNGLKAKKENALPDLILVCKTLHILPSSFDNFKSSWMLLSKDESRTFDELCTQLIVYERNRSSSQQTSSESNDPEALLVRQNHQKSGNSGKSKQSSKESTGNICHYCLKPGHWVRQCKKWIADGRPPPPSKKSAVSNVSTSASSNVVKTIALVSIDNLVLASEAKNDDWWIDNGATKHVTNRFDWFSSFRKFESPHTIKAAGSECLNAVGCGTVEIESTVEGQSRVTLHNVWFAPRISRNLFSPLAAHDKQENSKFESTVTSCTFLVNGIPVLTGTREKNGTLYRAEVKAVNSSSSSTVNVAESSDLLQLYHERWGHQDKRHVKEKLEKELDIKVKLELKTCEPCVYGKAHRLPFGTRKKATKPGELISADVCGPFNESFQKKRYLVTFKDSYTKFRYSFIIKEKSDVKVALEEMLTHAEKQGHNIKEFLSDNGGEFDNSAVRETLKTRGITQRLTAPFTPEQNGGSERENRTVVEMARTFMHSNPNVELPQAIWAELVTTAVYVLNRTGKSSENGVSPYELWFGKKPRINHLRIISSTCYVHIPKQKRRKMDKKAQKGYLVGYDGEERYRIYVAERKTVVLSRDVQFEETLHDCTEKISITFKSPSSEETEDEKADEPKPVPSSVLPELESSSNEDDDSEYKSASDTESEKPESSESARKLRSRDNIKPSKYFDDYVCVMTTEEEPQSYAEAIKRPESAAWQKAMEREMASLKENHTFKLVEPPAGAKIIPCKWVFRLKLNPDGSIAKYKARVVAKGYDQRKGIDYSQTFSPVAKLQTIRLLLGVAATEKMHLVQFDVSTAFLYGELDETIYMKQPEGFDDGSGKVWKLTRSLYGLKQSPRCWNKRIGRFLESLKFKASDEEPCMFIREEGGVKTILTLYVDDGMIASTSRAELEKFLSQLREEFKIVSEEASYFLGLEIKRQSNGDIKVCQKSYAQKILERFNFVGCRPVSSPMLPSPASLAPGKAPEITHQYPYRQAVGSLMYLMLSSRPDLAYAVGFLSRSLENPTTEDIARLKRVFRYIAGTLDLGLLYRHNAEKGIFTCYSDADFGGCTQTARSTTGVLVTYAGAAVSWLSQRQGSVTDSTTEAELVAASEASKEIIWLSRLLSQMSKLKEIPVLQIDNAAAVRLAENPENHRRTKHIQRKHFFVREHVTEGRLAVEQVPSEYQVADAMTKPIAAPRLRILCGKMGLF